jgi:hypothetical protein
MAADSQRKIVRSYRLVFRRRWRIFRIQGWRIPLPGGIELRLLGYWLVSLATIALLASLPLLGTLIGTMPASLRLLAVPIAAAWLLCRWEIDGRPPHRALAGLIAWRARPRHLAALRRVPPLDTELIPLGRLSLAPDLTAPRYPRGRLAGPARVLLRYPLRASARRGSRRTRCWRLQPISAPPLHKGKTLEIPARTTVEFESCAR